MARRNIWIPIYLPSGPPNPSYSHAETCNFGFLLPLDLVEGIPDANSKNRRENEYVTIKE